MKLALISCHLPPSMSGQSVNLSRMLSEFSPDEYCLMSAKTGVQGSVPLLPNPIHHLSLGYQVTRGYRRGLKQARITANFWTGVLHRAGQIAAIVKREQCDRIMACTGDVLDLPAAYLAARWLKLPFYTYVFDYYSEREWECPTLKYWARKIEGRVLRAAKAIIVQNEILAQAIELRYDVRAEVIHASFDLSPYEGEGPQANGHAVYTGEIYEAHYDSFRRFLEVIGPLGIPLHAYTHWTSEQLAALGMPGIVCHPPLPPEQVPEVQRGAEFLFLPLAFESPYPELVRTSATTKLGEYLASGRPVLIHAPHDCFVTWYGHRYRCAAVVERENIRLIGEEVQRIIGDVAFRESITRNARERAKEDFCIVKARNRFREILSR